MDTDLYMNTYKEQQEKADAQRERLVNAVESLAVQAKLLNKILVIIAQKFGLKVN